MSSLIKTIQLSQLVLKNSPVLRTSVRHHVIINDDYLPKQYPQTEKEMAAAAEKYGLPRADYKPVPDDGYNCGDYPDMPLESGDSRDDFYPWDNPELKRNFNEPLHVDFDLIRQDRVDVTTRTRFTKSEYVGQFLGVMGGAILIFLLAEKVKMFPAALPRQFPKAGEKHYTFEQN